MALRSLRVLGSYLTGGDKRQPGAVQRAPVKITLAPKAGMKPSGKAPVRIYLGTESAQFRAERTFICSVERVRDPARQYEIYLMKDFAGFERRLWLTGFTNYRFAIPELAGGEGRAIYNDTDQIYLKDPAVLFDTPMGEHGVLSINDHDTSVMLIDCARMLALWNWQSAQSTGNRKLEEQMRADPGLWGELDGIWNARDAEYVPDVSAVVHYTTIHTQPWRPSPQDYVYQANVASDIWLSIEREANAQGFQVFNAASPSLEYRAQAERDPVQKAQQPRADYQRLVRECGAASLHYCGFQSRIAHELGLAESVVSSASPRNEATVSATPSQADCVIVEGLEHLPDTDVSWVLARQFERADQAVIISVDCGNASTYSPADPLWWYAQVAAVAAQYPQQHWRLVIRPQQWLLKPWLQRWSGGALLQTKPRVWALSHYKTGHNSQVLGLAQALGWAFATKQISNTPLAYLAAVIGAKFFANKASLPGKIAAPWPDLVIASGWLPSLIARWINRRNYGNTRLILMGRRGGPVGESNNFGVHCQHFRLPPHPQHFETMLPPSKVSGRELAQAVKDWPDLFANQARPRVVLLVGGENAQCAFDASEAKDLASRVSKAVCQIGGSLAVLPSRRTGTEASAALHASLNSDAIFESWQPYAMSANPYLGYLAAADVLVVTGESESMLAEAVATGKPVYIYPLSERAPGGRQRLANWVYKQATTDRFNARGSRRPQEGLQYLCARLVEHRILLPPRDLDALHQSLVAHNLARLFDENLEAWMPAHWREHAQLAERIRSLLDSSPDEAEYASQQQSAHAANA